MPSDLPGGLRRRLVRAWRNTRPVDALFSVVPAIVTTGVTAYVAWLIRGEEGAHISTYFVPAIAGLIALCVVLFLLHGAEFAYRLATGKARKGTPRTLHGLSIDGLEEALRVNVIESGQGHVAMDQTTVEIENFASELNGLFTRAGWPMYELTAGSGHAFGRMVSGIEIYLPDGGNAGLEALGKALNRWGYKAIVAHAQSQNPEVIIGEAVR